MVRWWKRNQQSFVQEMAKTRLLKTLRMTASRDDQERYIRDATVSDYMVPEELLDDLDSSLRLALEKSVDLDPELAARMRAFLTWLDRTDLLSDFDRETFLDSDGWATLREKSLDVMRVFESKG